MADSRQQQLYSNPPTAKVTIKVAGREMACDVSDRLMLEVKSVCDAEFLVNYLYATTAKVTIRVVGR
ncbi:MAG: hypothetical protein ACYC0J_07575 [Gammaproteobacteria bacterium]